MGENGILEWGPVLRVRRNHGLEHATLNLLIKKYPGSPFSGHSDRQGFWIIGDISTDELLETAREALKRMREGEKRLAVHSNCGTNYVTTGLVAGSLVWLASLGNHNSFKKKLDRWPLMVMIVTGSLIAAQPLGPKVQEKISTSGEPGSMTIRQIIRYERSGPCLHRILTVEESAETVETIEAAES